MPKIAFLKRWYFYSLEGFFIDLKHCQTLFLGFFWRETRKENILNFWEKSWVNPFGKMPQNFDIFITWKAFFRSRTLANTFLGFILKKNQEEKISNFSQNHGLTLWKNAEKKSLFKSRYCYSLERFSIDLEY